MNSQKNSLALYERAAKSIAGALFPCFTEKEKIRNHREALAYSDISLMHRFGALMNQNGVIGDDRYCVSLAHTEDDVIRSIEIADRVLKIIKEEQ